MREPQTADMQWSFTCKRCGAPLAIERLKREVSMGFAPTGSWRVQCPCGCTASERRADAAVKIRLSN